jgi:hypothetical protein
VNDELERMWKETGVAYLSRYLPEGRSFKVITLSPSNSLVFPAQITKPTVVGE